MTTVRKDVDQEFDVFGDTSGDERTGSWDTDKSDTKREEDTECAGQPLKRPCRIQAQGNRTVSMVLSSLGIMASGGSGKDKANPIILRKLNITMNKL